MKMLLCVLSLTIPLTASAAKPAAAKPKPLPIADIIRDVATRGKDYVVDDSRGMKLDYPGKMPTKKLILDDENNPTQHAAIVTFADDGKPRDIIISSTTALIEGGRPVSIDGYSFRTDSTGRLIAGMRAVGKVGQVEQTKMDLAASETKNVFARILATIRAHPALRKKQ